MVKYNCKCRVRQYRHDKVKNHKEKSYAVLFIQRASFLPSDDDNGDYDDEGSDAQQSQQQQ